MSASPAIAAQPWALPEAPTPIELDSLQPRKWLYLLPLPADSSEAPDEPGPPPAGLRQKIRAVGRYMAEADYIPDAVLSARGWKAQEAAALLADTLDCDPVIWREHVMSEGTSEAILERLRRIAENIGSVLLMAGGASTAALAQTLSRDYGPYGARAARLRMLSGFPGGAFAALNLSIDRWSDLKADSGLIHAFVHPLDLCPQDH